MAFNNAGILGQVGDVTDETSGAFDDVIAVNLRGVWTCMKHEQFQIRTHGGPLVTGSTPKNIIMAFASLATGPRSRHEVEGICQGADFNARDNRHPGAQATGGDGLCAFG
jgi:NAD(P)-dependent dehydrogenase (short-subunit alcohol dehydrogenase family)